MKTTRCDKCGRVRMTTRKKIYYSYKPPKMGQICKPCEKVMFDLPVREK